MSDEEDGEVKLTIDSTPKLHIKKFRDPRPSVWLSVFKWIFGILLGLMLLTSVIASKLSLLAIGSFYNSTRSACPRTPYVQYSKETTFIMMIVTLMIPQLLSFLRACLQSLCSAIHPWPTNSAIFWTIFAAILEVFGLSYFVLVVILKTTLSAAHCIIIMNCIFLVPIIAQLTRFKELIKTSKLALGFLILSGLLEIAGIVLLTIDVIELKTKASTLEAILIPVSLVLVSLSWCNTIQKWQIEPRINENNLEQMERRDGADSTTRIDTDVEILYRKTARDKSTIISGIVKLIATPLVAWLLGYCFDIADATKILQGFENFNSDHPAFSHFMVQIFTSFMGCVLGWLVCAMCMQKLAFLIPMILATPLSLGVIAIPGLCCASALPFKCENFHDVYMIVTAVVLWFAQILSTGIYLKKGQTFIMAKESSLFWIPVYNDAFLEQSLLLNRKNEITDESHLIQPDIVKDSCIYICTTMYHENKQEMEQLLHSLHDVDTAMQGRSFESHIFFDGAVQDDVLNDYVLQLISLVPETLKADIDKCMKIRTPYGIQLRWRLNGGMPFHIHLKDNTKVKNKKRWSQAMYMSYVLDYKDSTDDYTYILATDADVKFTHESVQALLDLMIRDEKVGAACGRTHPLGSGPIVWYQIFDYAIGHWFQKVANHVLGSVLCSPGCFSVYRARAIRDVLPIYASGVNDSIDFLTKDMGEDRWMCTLMVQSGWKLEYCAAAEDRTYCPESFDEFFNQRRRWIPSTLVNLIQVISKWQLTVENNDKISHIFLLYQLILVVATLLSPATVILVITGALKFSKFPGAENDTAVLIVLCIITFGFALICLYTKQSFQLKVAKILTIFFSLMMTAVTVGMAAQIAQDLRKRSLCDDLKTIVADLVDTTIKPTTITLPSECTDGLPADVSTLYFAGLIGIFLIAALLHPDEALCLVHGIWYLLCLPSGYLLLIIYSLANITDRSWGTRETKVAKAGDDIPWYKELWDRMMSACFCCRPRKENAEPQQSKSADDEQPAEESSDEVFPDDTNSMETNQDQEIQDNNNELPGPSTAPQPRELTMKSILKRSKSSDEIELGAWRYPGDKKKTVKYKRKEPQMDTEMVVDQWLPQELRTLYAKNFIDNGYDNISFIVGMTDKDLRDIGIDVRGHRTQIIHLIKDISHTPLDTDVPENVEEWLRKLGLEHYWPYFKDNGYTGPKMLEELKAMDKETLKNTLVNDLKIRKSGHLRKMINAIKNLQYPTAAQREIRQARAQVRAVKLDDLETVNNDGGKEYRFWKSLRNRCLLPESTIFGAVTQLKEKLVDLRDSVLTVFAVANVMWIITIFTLDKQSDLKFKGTNAIGFAFIVVFGVVIVIQFLAMVWHRLSTLCHLLARAPWKRGPYQMAWAFQDEALPPKPTLEDLEQIRRIREKRKTRRQTGRDHSSVHLNPIAGSLSNVQWESRSMPSI